MLFRSAIVLLSIVAALGATSYCEDNNKNQDVCFATVEDGSQCAFCTSGAVGNTCLKEEDAKGLPSSVFKCSYKTLAAAPAPLKDASVTYCEDNNKDKQTCLSTVEDGEQCAFCTSGAVGNTCLKASDAKGLPTSVFKCVYDGYLRTAPVAAAAPVPVNTAAAATCEESNKSQSVCLSTVEDGSQCAFCTSGAVGNSCLKAEDAKGLPPSVFRCVYA